MTQAEQHSGHSSAKHVSGPEPLTEEEDDELRRLNYLSRTGTLSQRSRARMNELRLRDRRETIRPPREHETMTTKQRTAGYWARFFPPRQTPPNRAVAQDETRPR